MVFGFLFWLFLVGIIVASLQDLKRREVDNWLNLFLLVVGFVFIFYRAIFEKDVSLIFQAGFALVVMFTFMNLFYHGRIFAGGDAKLLVAMTVFFIGADFNMTLINIGVFLLFLMFSGSVYGLVYSVVLYLRDYKKINKVIKGEFSNLLIRYVLLIVVMFLVLGTINIIFLFLGVFVFLLSLLYVLAKSLEVVSMVKSVSGKNLREGDWLVDDVKVGKKVVKADWGGLSLEDIKLLKSRKKVKIKDGLPFVPAFLIAFLAYVFLKDWFLGLFLLAT